MPTATKTSRPKRYERFKEERRRIAAQESREGREIGAIPPVKNIARRIAASRDFLTFCETYFPHAFYLAWSEDQKTIIAKIANAIKHGGQFAHAMPRGSGKSTITETACLWALLNGSRHYVALIAATADRATDIMESMVTELECNELLLADFPEVIYPIRCLQRIHNRAAGQTYQGQPTRITLTTTKVVLPNIKGSQASSAIITATGLTGGNVRGQRHKLPTGQVIRPSLVVIDDPQTTETAYSATQSARREALLAGDVLGMAGPTSKITVVMCCTIIRPGDMADRILDREIHPEWQGTKTKMVYQFPTDTGLWDKYTTIRTESLKADGDGREATEFYRANREAMDAGSKVAWPQRHNDDEISALQHAMNLRMADEAAFNAEYQNEPLVEEGDSEQLTEEKVAAKINGYKPGQIPTDADHLTMCIDIHDKLLFWMVVAWASDFSGYIIDYGTYPDQRRAFFTMRDSTVTLGRRNPGTGREGAIQTGLTTLLEKMLPREWPKTDGTIMQIGRCLIDSGYVPKIVYGSIRKTTRMAVVMPSKGVGLGPDSKPFSEYRRKAGERYGLHWRTPATRGTREMRTIHVDVNFWKSFCYDRFVTASGDPGSLTMYGQASDHRLLAMHMVSEFRTWTQGRSRVVYVWKQRPNVADNHWWDCLVGNATAAAMLGCALPGMDPNAHRTRRRTGTRLRLSALQGR